MHALSRALLAAALLVPPLASAQDFAAEAEARMGLSFDLESVEGRLSRRPARAAPAPYYEDALHGGMVTPVVAAPVAPLPLEPNSDVDTVIVFKDRAVVTRVLTVAIDAGERAVTFEGLPLGLMPSSLEGRVRAGQAEIVGVELSAGVGEVRETERIRSIQEEALSLTEALGAIRDRIESLLAQRAYLRATLIGGVREAAPPPLSQVRDGFAYVGATEAEIARQLREEEKRASDLGEQLVPLLVKLDNPLATGQSVTVQLAGAGAGEVTLALQYQVPGAYWTPAYNARLEPDGDRVELEYFGVVTNTTAEVWKDARLSLSTARPAAAGGLPGLAPWLLGESARTVQGAMASGPGHYELSASTPGTADAATAARAGAEGVGVVVFAIPGARTVQGDGSPQRLPIGTHVMPATVSLATVPKVAPEVIRKARVRYDGALPLLPGPVSTYVGPDYVGAGTIGAVVPGEALELSFGAEDRLLVTRQLVSRHVEHLGFGKNTVRYTFAFRVALTNLTGRVQSVDVLDQLPVSELEGVTVRALSVSDGLIVEDGDSRGLLRWRLTPAPGETSAVTLEFSVTAPVSVSDRTLYEMERMM